MSARNPAPTLLNDYTSPALMWAIVVVFLLGFIAWAVMEYRKARETLSPERLDAVQDEPWEISRCTIEDCPNVGVQLFHANHGFIWVCHQHAPAVTQWTGPAVFDQDQESA